MDNDTLVHALENMKPLKRKKGIQYARTQNYVHGTLQSAKKLFEEVYMLFSKIRISKQSIQMIIYFLKAWNNKYQTDNTTHRNQIRLENETITFYVLFDLIFVQRVSTTVVISIDNYSTCRILQSITSH